ncbi:MAG: hypothetical protein RLZZ553_1196 [Verrucomicrobiota bacterium]|jgi:hypothetical protein
MILDPFQRQQQLITRRQFFGKSSTGIGTVALASLLNRELFAAPAVNMNPLEGLPHLPPKAKNVILLWQGGGPSQIDLFQHKPGLEKLRLTELPASVRGNTRLSTMTASQGKYPILSALKPFQNYGKCGRMLSSLLPHTGSIVDDICFIDSMHTEAVNHAPGVTFFLTGSQVPGRPSLGAWGTYGLGCLSQDLPSFVVMTSSDKDKTCGQLFFDYYWGSGFLPSKYQGVRFRSDGDPVLYLKNPSGIDRSLRRSALDDLAAMNQHHLERFGDPEIDTRISQYEMAYRMQMSVPELTDLSKETPATLAMYGPDVQREGSFARHCLLARKLVERGTRFVQLMHAGWDQHKNLSYQLANQCQDTDQPAAALVKDLKQRGLLDDTIVLWISEFGRTVFVQGDINNPRAYGRDHFGVGFTIWGAGGGFKPGYSHGETDDFAYRITRDPVHVHDIQATLLHLLGIHHEKLTFRYQGRDFRLTDVHGKVVSSVVS